MTPEQLTSYAKSNAPTIDKATNDVYGMLEDLINFSPDRTVLLPEKVDIAKFFSEITAEFPEISIRSAVNGQAQHVFDRLKLKRVLINILKNAMEATDARGSYWIEARNEVRALEIEIGNLGSKIDQERLPKIFDAFFTAGKVNGTGLGMAIAKKFTEEHDGEIWCESNGWTSKNESTTLRRGGDYVIFTIRLPQEPKS